MINSMVGTRLAKGVPGTELNQDIVCLNDSIKFLDF